MVLGVAAEDESDDKIRGIKDQRLLILYLFLSIILFLSLSSSFMKMPTTHVLGSKANYSFESLR